MQKIVKNNGIVVLICILLFLIPFFWFLPSQIELGGDSNRLYLLDPDAYLRINTIFGVESEALGKLRADQSVLPFVFLLKMLTALGASPFLLMTLLNSTKLVISFGSIYLIMRKFQGSSLAAILAGLFYTLSPSVGENLKTALLTHNQIFLNPLMFYLLLMFLITHISRYIWVALLMSVIFAPNFSLTAPPPFFSFYPLALTFLFLYTKLYVKNIFPWRQLFIALAAFLFLHSFHLIPEILFIFDPGSLLHERLFEGEVIRNEGLQYFNGILWYGKVITNLFVSNVVVWPVVVIIGLFIKSKFNSLILLISAFFLFTLFLMAANITDAGVSLYRVFIQNPAFSMFRNFYGQFQWVYMFFYALLFGCTSHVLMRRLKKRYVCIFAGVVLISICYMGWPYLTGNVFRKPVLSSKGLTSVIELDSDFSKTLTFIKNLPEEGKIISFPFTDFSYQVVPGVNNGVYIGPSVFSYLAGKKHFSGYQHLGIFSETFFRLIKERDVVSLRKLFILLNIRYIVLDQNPKSYVEYFPVLPFTHLSKTLPNTESLAAFVLELSSDKIFEQGSFSIYKIPDTEYVSHIYIPQSIESYNREDELFFVTSADGFVHTLNLNYAHTLTHMPKVQYSKINPTKYKVIISDAKEPFVLVFSDQFNQKWKLSGVKDEKHFIINGYANAWYIQDGKASYNLTIEMINQQKIMIGFWITLVSLCVFIIYGLIGFKQKII